MFKLQIFKCRYIYSEDLNQKIGKKFECIEYMYLSANRKFVKVDWSQGM